MSLASFTVAKAPEDKLLGLLTYFLTRNWHTMVINICMHNALFDSLAIILLILFNIVLNMLLSTILLLLAINNLA